MEAVACNTCRTRKLRCSKNRPSCTYCIKHKITCVYHAKVIRAPLTRAKVSSLEHRAKCLERALLELNPDANLDAILSNSATNGTVIATLCTTTNLGESAESCSGRMHTAEIQEEVPQTSTGFDWREGTSPDASPADGMATLSLNSNGSGYLGNFAAVALLRVLRKTEASLDSVDQQLHEPPERIASSATDPFNQGYMTDQSIDAYFQHFHPSYPLLHEATFRAQASDLVPKPHGGVWELLYKAVVVTGAWCAGYPHSNEGLELLLGASNNIPNSTLLGSGSLCVVQAFTILSLHLQKLNQPNLGYVYRGAAVRMAISLGLQREFPSWKITQHEREVRRRVWWCLYVFDSGQSITMGRPILLPSKNTMDIQLPLNIYDSNLTVTTLEQPNAVEEPTIYSHIIAQARFQMIFNSIYDRLISIPGITPAEALQYDATISEWEKTVPSYLKASLPGDFSYPWLAQTRYRLTWRVRGLRMLIFLPAVLRWVGPNKGADSSSASKDEQLGIMKCLDYAHLNILSIQDYFLHESANVLGEWYALYFISQASLISILAVVSGLEALVERQETVMNDIKIVKKLLDRMSARSRHAQVFANVVDRLVPHDFTDNDSWSSLFDDSIWEAMLSESNTGIPLARADEAAWVFWPTAS